MGEGSKRRSPAALEGEGGAGPSTLGDPGHHQKRVKFDAVPQVRTIPARPSPGLEAEEPERDAEELVEELGTRKPRRGAVKADVYGSDDDDDDEGRGDGDDGEDGVSSGSEEEGPRQGHLKSRLDARLRDQALRSKGKGAAGKQAGGEEEEDMFGEAPRPKAPQDKRRLQSRDIEGQEWAEEEEYQHRVGEVVDESTGMVTGVTAFNMDKELEEGDFDASGHYRVRKDEHAIHDTWLQDVSKTDMERARLARERQQQAQAVEKGEGEEGHDPIPTDVNGIWHRIWALLRPGQSVLSALKQLGGGKPASLASKWKARRKASSSSRSSMDQDDQGQGPQQQQGNEQERARQAKILELTRLADRLMSMGHYDAYDKTHEQLTSKLRQLGLLGEETATRAPTFEYKWSLEATEVFGPFTHEQLAAWKAQGFFAHAPVYIRRVRKGQGAFVELGASGLFPA